MGTHIVSSLRDLRVSAVKIARELEYNPPSAMPDLREQLHLVRGELELVNKILLQESLMGFPDGDRRINLCIRREELKAEERRLLEALAQQ